MPIHTAEAEWQGTLREGKGQLSGGSRAFDMPYTFTSRFETGRKETNPEELIGAAHAGCFTMALVASLDRQGIRPERVTTKAQVSLDKSGDGFAITRIVLQCEALVPGIDPEKFQRLAADAKANCPVSKALAGVADIQMTANLAR